MIRVTMVSLIFALAQACARADGGEIGFSVLPAVARKGPATLISFTASAATDVEVAILDASGNVVRRLAAGMLGPNAPEPFEKGSLVQKVAWDGADDAGKPVAGASARVRLGMRLQEPEVVKLSIPRAPKGFPGARPGPYKLGPGAGPRIGWTDDRTQMSCQGYMVCGDPRTVSLYARLLHSETAGHASFRWVRLDPKTGRCDEVLGLRNYTYEILFGVDGLIYPMHWGWVTKRLNREWQPAPFPGAGGHGIANPMINEPELEALGFGNVEGRASTCVGLDGKLYAFRTFPATGYARLCIWGREGKLEKRGQIPFVKNRAGTGIRVDRLGHLCVGINGVPEGYRFPDGMDENRKAHIGSVVRIVLPEDWAEKPLPNGSGEGGLVLNARRGTSKNFAAEKLAVPGAVAAAPGIAPVMPLGFCTCSKPRFDMDWFGRLYLPDGMAGAIRVCDRNGNELAAVQGKVGDLALAWPVRVAAAGDSVFFYDYRKGLLVRLHLHYQASETVRL